MAHFRILPHRCKNLADISYRSRVIDNFVPNFIAMATGVGREKCDWRHRSPIFVNPSINAKKSRKNLIRKPSYSQFCPKFCCHGNGQRGSIGRRCDWRDSMAHPEHSPIGAKISYASQVIANFVPNFVAMATGVNRG